MAERNRAFLLAGRPSRVIELQSRLSSLRGGPTP